MQPAATASNRRSATDEERRAAREVAKAEFFHAPLSSHTYRILHVIGEGAYGVVCAAVNEASSERVAIKRIKSVLDSYPVATRILRELKFLRLLRHHENVVTVADVLVPGERDRFNDAFVVSELMPTDLSKLLRSATPLSGDHVKYLMFQLLRAVHFLHSSNVFHRDIKPNNILVNKKCELRVCDFGTSSGERGGGGEGQRGVGGSICLQACAVLVMCVVGLCRWLHEERTAAVSRCPCRWRAAHSPLCCDAL